MFSDYFHDTSRDLKTKLKKRLGESDKAAKPKRRLGAYKDLYEFWSDHLPNEFHIGPGKIRGKSHMLPKPIDIIFYRKWCKRQIEMAGGWHLTDYTAGFGSIEENLTTQALLNHINLTQAIKTLYAKSKGLDEKTYIPMVSVLWSYDNKLPLLSHQKAIYDVQKEKNIDFNTEIDIVIILDQGLIMKDWESGSFRVIETGKDTLMWAYVIMSEYLGLDATHDFVARDYIKRSEDYAEY